MWPVWPYLRIRGGLESGADIGFHDSGLGALAVSIAGQSIFTHHQRSAWHQPCCLRRLEQADSDH